MIPNSISETLLLAGKQVGLCGGWFETVTVDDNILDCGSEEHKRVYMLSRIRLKDTSKPRD